MKNISFIDINFLEWRFEGQIGVDWNFAKKKKNPKAYFIPNLYVMYRRYILYIPISRFFWELKVKFDEEIFHLHKVFKLGV